MPNAVSSIISRIFSRTCPEVIRSSANRNLIARGFSNFVNAFLYAARLEYRFQGYATKIVLAGFTGKGALL